jgi:tRNA (adenine57-N1/adenine58-N1)-methyltransferase catalytic subunit
VTWNLHSTLAMEGDLAELVGLRHQHFIIRLSEGGELQTHRGVLRHDDLIGKPWGSQVLSHNLAPFFLLQPALADLIRNTPRNTQILYPKDIGYIMIHMGIGPGIQIIEAGTGSGSLTTALAYAVGDKGQVISYELRPEMQARAIKNLERLGLADRVIFKLRDIEQGFDESGMDALFLDVQNPFDYIPQVRSALKPGGFFGCIVPTTNQVIHLLIALRRNQFAFIETVEVLLRYYKSEPDHFRPNDRMVAHTGFLIFARPVILMQELTEDLQELLTINQTD